MLLEGDELMNSWTQTLNSVWKLRHPINSTRKSMGWVGMCLHYTCSVVLFEFFSVRGVTWGWQDVLASRWWVWALTLIYVTQSQGGGRSVPPPLHSESLGSGPVQQEGHQGYAPFGACGHLKVHLKGPRWLLQRKWYSELQERDKAPASALPSVWVFHI